MKPFILLILTLLIFSSTYLDNNELENKIWNSLDEQKLKDVVYEILFKNNGDSFATLYQTGLINNWKTIQNEFLAIIHKIIEVYHDNSKTEITYTNFNFQIYKKLFELIFNFVLNLYKNNPSVHLMRDSIIQEYFKKFGNKLAYPNWADNDKIEDILYAFNFDCINIFNEINDFNQDEFFINVGYHIGDLIFRSMKVLLLTKEEYNYFRIYDHIFIMIWHYFILSREFLIQNFHDNYFSPNACLEANITTFKLIKKLVTYTCSNNNCDSKKAIKFILENFKDIFFKDLKYCLTKDSYLIGQSIFSNDLTLGNLLYNIENLKEFENIDDAYFELNTKPFEESFINHQTLLTIIVKKILNNRETISNEYFFQIYDILQFIAGFIKIFPNEFQITILAQIEEQSYSISQIQTYLNNFLHIRVNNIIYYFEVYGLEYLKIQIYENIHDNPDEFSLNRGLKNFKKFLDSLSSNEIENHNLKVKNEFENTLIILVHYIDKFITSINEFNFMKKDLNRYFFNQFSQKIIQYVSENLRFVNIQKIHQAIEKHDFRLLGEMFSNMFFSIYNSNK